MRHVITALVQNRPGVLAHVAGMFAGRGFNIDSLVVGRTDQAELSRMTIVVNGDQAMVEQVRKQLEKMIPVVKVRDYSDVAYVERDLLLVKVNVAPEQREEVLHFVELFRGHVIDVANGSLTVEMTGTEDKLEAFIELVRPFGIAELSRTGVIAMQRGETVAPKAAVRRIAG